MSLYTEEQIKSTNHIAFTQNSTGDSISSAVNPFSNPNRAVQALFQARTFNWFANSLSDKSHRDAFLTKVANSFQQTLNTARSYLDQITSLQDRNTKLETENHRLSTQPEPAARVKPCDHPAEIADLKEEIRLLKSQIVDNVEFQTDLKNQITELEEREEKLTQDYNHLIDQGQETLELLPNCENIEQFHSAVKGLIQREHHADQLAGDNQAIIFEWENVGLDLLPNKDGIPPTALEAQIAVKQLINSLGATLDRLKMAPSGVISGQTLSPENISTLWKNIPEIFRNGKQATPTTSVELLQALSTLTCHHPRELALTLSLPENNDWDNSIEAVNDLALHVCPTITASSQAQGTRLFKASDVPRFNSTKEYSAYRTALRRFLDSEDPPALHEQGRALNRILGTFEDPVALAASASWDVTPLIRNSWTDTVTNFLAALDLKFQSPTILEDTQIEFLKVKPKDGESPVDFFNRFDAAANQLRAIQVQRGIPLGFQLTDKEVSARLITVVPRYLTFDVRLSLLRQGKSIELCSPAELRIEYLNTWAYLAKPASSSNVTNTPRTAHTRSTPASGSAATKAKEPKTYMCGFHGNYDTSPPVPQELRGSIYVDPRGISTDAECEARRKRCATIPVCLNCRRPRSQHQTVGATFRPISAAASTRASPAQITAPPPRLTIEAAPPAPSSQ
jgi:hypothetical protein